MNKEEQEFYRNNRKALGEKCYFWNGNGEKVKGTMTNMMFIPPSFKRDKTTHWYRYYEPISYQDEFVEWQIGKVLSKCVRGVTFNDIVFSSWTNDWHGVRSFYDNKNRQWKVTEDWRKEWTEYKPPERVELCAEDIAKRTDIRVRKSDWIKGHFTTIIDVSEYTIEMKHATFSYKELMTWVWLSDGTPCSKEAE